MRFWTFFSSFFKSLFPKKISILKVITKEAKVKSLFGCNCFPPIIILYWTIYNQRRERVFEIKLKSCLNILTDPRIFAALIFHNYGVEKIDLRKRGYKKTSIIKAYPCRYY